MHVIWYVYLIYFFYTVYIQTLQFRNLAQKENNITALLRRSLTKVFDRWAVVIVDCDHAGPEHLQGGDVGREDTECTGECGHINLLHIGPAEKHLETEVETGWRDAVTDS